MHRASCAQRARRRFLLTLGVAVVTLACGRDTQQGMGTAALTLLSVDTLLETDSLFVGRPRDAVRDARGHTLVVDALAGRVVEFDAAFAPVRTIGRAGQGPGEFSGPSTLSLWGSDTLAVVDLPGQAVNLYRLSTGAFLRRLTTPGVARSVASTADVLLLGTLSATSLTASGVVSPGDTAVRATHPLPPQILANPIGLRMFPTTWIAGLGDSVALMFTTSDRLFLGAIRGDSLSSLRMPASRRGSVPDTVDAMLLPVLRSPERLLLFPAPAGIQWRADGLILVWHRRWRPIGEALSGSFERADAEVTSTAFLTVLDRERRRACVDLEIPTEWAEAPSALFADANVFYVLGHALAADANRPTLELRRYSIPLESCAWTTLDESP